MALLLPKSLFIHIPKTGGSWVRDAIQRAGIPTDEILPSSAVGISWAAAMHASSHCITDRFRFAFVRHPLTFYQSYWCYKMQVGWSQENAFEAKIASESFPEFVRSVLHVCPTGWVTTMYIRALGYAFSNVEYIGRTERLVDDLVTALRLAGESFDEERLRATPPKNVSSQLVEWQDRCVYSDDLRRAVCTAELRVLEHFGYTENVPEDLPTSPRSARSVT